MSSQNEAGIPLWEVELMTISVGEAHPVTAVKEKSGWAEEKRPATGSSREPSLNVLPEADITNYSSLPAPVFCTKKYLSSGDQVLNGSNKRSFGDKRIFVTSRSLAMILTVSPLVLRVRVAAPSGDIWLLGIELRLGVSDATGSVTARIGGETRWLALSQKKPRLIRRDTVRKSKIAGRLVVFDIFNK